MDYTELTDADHDELRRAKIRAIEIDHARLVLDLKAAEAVGITDGEQIAVAKANLSVLVRQHDYLLAPPPEPGGNGRAMPARQHQNA